MTDSETVALGVGIDTARYGHHVTFLREDLQPATTVLEVPESREGYERLRKKFQELSKRYPSAHFHIRLDMAGQYGVNLEVFLRSLPIPKTITMGEPARNKNYRQAHFPKRKADVTESFCAARFALVERPREDAAGLQELADLREVASRLEGQTRQTVRLTNQLHNVLARVFPELAVLLADLAADWVLALLAKYPTASKIARARLDSLTAIRYLTADKARRIQSLAAESIGTFQSATAETVVQQLVVALRTSKTDENRLARLLVQAYRKLPDNQISSIAGIGELTAAILTAKIGRIERFATPAQLVSYFGVFPEERSSGFDKQGQPKTSTSMHMSRQGNDLVRKYLWNCAKTAMMHNPAVRALYRRLVARGRRGDVALGHCMRKLLHLVYAVWTTGKPFDPQHYPWEVDTSAVPKDQPAPSEKKTAAGRSQEQSSEKKAVTAADPNVERLRPTVNWIEFAELRQQVTLEQVLAHLGLLEGLSGSGAQRRGRCPIHSSDKRQRTFSVNLEKNAFRCFDSACRSQGNTLDLWAAVHKLPLREAALHMAATLNCHAPRNREEEPVMSP
jgi:transposase